MLDTYHKQAKKRLVATVISLIIIAGVVVYTDHVEASDGNTSNAANVTATTSTPSTNSTPHSTTPTDMAAPTTSSSSSSISSGYKDGTYSATSDYYVPHGDEEIQVSLTLKDGVVTGASIQNSESDRESVGYQKDFASAYKSYVVGKKISGLRLSVISGASDTTQGFNDAVSQIASKAQA